MKVLVVQTRQEQMRALQLDEEITFDWVIINHPDQVRYIEGLRIKEVFITFDVLTNGLSSRLFDQLYRQLISMSVDPQYAFRIFDFR